MRRAGTSAWISRPRNAILLAAAFAAVSIVAVGAGGCLFSTNPPDVREPTPPEEVLGPEDGLVTGLVRKREGGELRKAPSHWVEVSWYALGAGGREQVTITELQTDRDGTYKHKFTHKDITRVVVRAQRCAYNPSDPIFDCCADLNNPCGTCPPRWDPPSQPKVTTGGRQVQIDIIVSNCPDQPTL